MIDVYYGDSTKINKKPIMVVNAVFESWGREDSKTSPKSPVPGLVSFPPVWVQSMNIYDRVPLL